MSGDDEKGFRTFEAAFRPSDVDPVLRVLSHPVRRSMVQALAQRDIESGELAWEAFCAHHLLHPTVSGHLRQLREAGLVVSRPRESVRIYTLLPERLAGLAAWARDVAAADPGRWVGWDVDG